ncbi:lysophospholipid acyltransferase LPEAT1 isoform X2 [Aegilops tauschii subsp. strangulata]|uniref:lysophospholipid acyltransferase LPEAT1 isoform X2 n=1 Tax=Aegilops tauschii subsp. strangulata TaxID=200361 RepID=UPI00098AB888|nr:lysophospholipid acyltransferase LPEAT1 isoform X2 [Aegilops tauschii subsp. strangulata]XP_044356646.1 lysophospholipid acyltransferase LPEAT1-like isoform X2 [Triticum aestivum]
MAVDTTTAAPSHPEGDEGGEEAVRPLLSGAPAEVEDEELDIRYAPYARRDAYGPMGRGPLSAAQVARLVLAGVVLLPLRLVAGVLLVVAYYLVCRVCTLFVGGVGEGRPRLQGLRREAVLRAGRVLSRAMLFVFGFYWIPVSDRSFPNAEDVPKDHYEELERPGAIVSNHVSYVDILYHMSASSPSFVAKNSVSKLPLIGLISKCLGCIFVQRESKCSDSKGVSGAVTERLHEVSQDENSPMILLFPGTNLRIHELGGKEGRRTVAAAAEGTTTNGDYLLPFKTGAFLARAPLQPVILRYPCRRFSPAWDSMDGARHVFLLLCQFANYIEVVRLPVYYPSEQEKQDPRVYANNVRKLLATEGNLVLSNLGLAEKRAYHAALNGLLCQS